MLELIRIKRVVVVADASLQKSLLDEFLKLGAHGYTCVYCFGKGEHEVIEDPFTGRSRIRIELLARPEVATAILEFIHKSKFEILPVIGFMDEVEVNKTDRFF